MTLAYLTRSDAWHLANGQRSKLRPLICLKPRKPVRLTLATINRNLQGIIK